MKNINTPEFWDGEFQKEYDAWVNKNGYQRWRPARFEEIATVIPANSRVLDVGCGLGHFCRYLHARNPGVYEVYGTDFSEFAVSKAKEYDKKTNYYVSDAYSFRIEPVDALTAQEIIEHLDDVPRFLEEIKKTVKPGGLVVITTPENVSQFHEVNSDDHVHEFNRGELVNIMNKICKVIQINSYHFPFEEATMIYIGRMR